MMAHLNSHARPSNFRLAIDVEGRACESVLT